MVFKQTPASNGGALLGPASLGSYPASHPKAILLECADGVRCPPPLPNVQQKREEKGKRE